jgi:hypothetical protein
MINWVELNPPERVRVYHFPNNETITFYGVKRIEVRESGKHRIETTDGNKYFVSPGWLWLKIDTDEWTF